MKQQSILLAALFVSCSVIFNANGQAPAAPAAAAPATAAAPADNTPSDETLVMIRHGEKPADDQGQLTFQGLNRALALPDVLIAKYGSASFVFAPASHRANGGAFEYSYIRPLITIEPTAIRLHQPVIAKYTFDDVDGIEKELLLPTYKSSLIFVAWEHGKLDVLVKQMMKDLGGDATTVPDWPAADFDSIFVLKIHTDGGKRTITFKHDQEGLDGQSKEEPMPHAK